MFGRKKIKRDVDGYFSLSGSSWLVLPRVLMNEMSEHWQNRFVECLDEFDQEFPNWSDRIDGDLFVTAKIKGRFVQLPDWADNYRNPNKLQIMMCRRDKK